MPYPRKVPRKPPEGYMTVEEAAKLLDMGPASFYRYRRLYADDFPQPLMEGGRAWYRKSELEDWKRRHMGG